MGQNRARMLRSTLQYFFFTVSFVTLMRGLADSLLKPKGNIRGTQLVQQLMLAHWAWPKPLCTQRVGHNPFMHAWKI